MTTPSTSKAAATIRRAEEAEARNRLARARLESRALRALSGATPRPRRSPSRGQPTTTAMFRAATRRRVNPGPAPQGGSGRYNSPVYQLRTIRAEARDVRQNSWLGRAIIKRLADFVVSDGPVFQVNTGNPAIDEQVQTALTDWAEGQDPAHYGPVELTERYDLARMLRQLVQTALTDGDHLLPFVSVANGTATPTVTVQMIVADRIASPNGLDMTVDGYTQGVRLDEYGRPIAFRVCQWFESGSAINFSEGRDINANAALWWRNPMDDVSDAVRGEPGLASILDRLDFLESYLESVGLAAEIATRFGLVIKSERPASMASALESISTEAAQQAGMGPDGSAPEIDLPMASVLHLKPGEEAMQVKPDHPTQNLRDFLMLYIGGITADVGVALAAVLYDATGMSWSNIKALLAMNWSGINTYQAALKADVILPYARRKLVEWQARGIIPALPPGTRVTCSMPSMPVLDFASEVDGYAEAIRANLMTNEEAAQRLGTGRWATLALTRKRERELENEYGINPVLLPGSKTMRDIDGDGANTAGETQ